jgi:hypothetical protein
MIIEFAGPPTVGKTTCARVLGARLRERGLQPNVVLSFRPNELSGTAPTQRGPVRGTAALRRLLRPVWQMTTIGCAGGQEERRLARGLMELLRPPTAFASFRMQQYLLRLAFAWRKAAESAAVSIFDQGFVQAICSLATAARSTHCDQLGCALDCVPKPDLLVRLTAPKHELAIRLAERRRGQSFLERLLELDPAVSLASANIFDELDRLLPARGYRIAWLEASAVRPVEAVNESLDRAIASFSTDSARSPAPVPAGALQ